MHIDSGYRLTGADSYRRITVAAARSLATRYSRVVRAIRSWRNPAGASRSDFRVVIDNMMNLDLLFWAADHGGRPGLARKALHHALRTASANVRADGSTYHLIVYNARTGAVKHRWTAQGYRNWSTWSRGQAWGLYGFGTAYAETRDPRMLATARRLADYFVSHLPADRVPYWDFNAPRIPNEPRDSSAAAIAASGLLQLSELETDRTRAQRYLTTAREILTSLSSPARTRNTPAAILAREFVGLPVSASTVEPRLRAARAASIVSVDSPDWDTARTTDLASSTEAE